MKLTWRNFNYRYDAAFPELEGVPLTTFCELRDLLGRRYELSRAELLSISTILALTGDVEYAAEKAPDVVKRVGRDNFRSACHATILTVRELHRIQLGESGRKDSRESFYGGNQKSGTFASAPPRAPRSSETERIREDYYSAPVPGPARMLITITPILDLGALQGHAPDPGLLIANDILIPKDLADDLSLMEIEDDPVPSESAPLPHFVPNTSQHRKWRASDGVHLLSTFRQFGGTRPVALSRSFRNGSFKFFVSYGELMLASPRIHPNARQVDDATLVPGDVYIHINDDFTKIQVWQLVNRENRKPSRTNIDRTWLNVSASFVANDGSITHPSIPGCVLVAHISLMPTYLRFSTLSGYMRTDENLRGALEYLAADQDDDVADLKKLLKLKSK
ncbi:hypothetical protein CVT24_007485 [Panaeolus cyanescens]|uniref:Uncharacterized protein n=1 Tax=Panaeolus cyanescens TaxID=181874 RepID=A0A409YWI4_9AGAR|nr:hypothetical protein CVT24_007485 [Panaeolus cyanescens]